MKTHMLRSIAAFVMAAIFPLCTAHASLLDDLLGYNPGYTHTYSYSVTNPGLEHRTALQYGNAGAPTAAPATQRGPVVAQQLVAPRTAYQQPVLQAAEKTQQVSPKAVQKKKSVQSARGANGGPSAAAQTPNQKRQAPAAKSYQPNYTAQPRQSSYYANPYMANPNYYQGYYGTWGSSPLACPPGRA